MKKYILLLLISLCFNEWNGSWFASKFLNKNNNSLDQKKLGAERIKKIRASKEINIKLIKYKNRLNIEQFRTVEDNITSESRCEDCMGNDCSEVEDWIGDGTCDDGTWGIYYNCDAYDCDGGDCLNEDGTCAENVGGGGGECEEGFVDDCSGDGDCCSESWIGDGYPDCEDQEWECDLTCYDNDGGDCGEGTDGGDDNGGYECEDLGQDTCYMLEGCIWTEEGCVEDVDEECEEGTVDDCSGDGDCCPEIWIGDGIPDCEDQQWGCDLSCYEGEINDCEGNHDGAEIEDFDNGNFNNFNWELSGNSNWIIDNLEFFEGGFSAKSGLIDHDQNSILSINYESTEDSEISFYRKISCENVGATTGNYYDYLSFQINGIEQDKWAGIQDWSLVSFPVDLGMNAFSWVYHKDSGVVSGEDAVWIDFVIFPINQTQLLGDLNQDGEINVVDIVLLVGIILEPDNPPSDIEFTAGDYNQDGEINVVDIVQVVQYILN